MDDHVSGPSFGPRLTGLGEESAGLRPRVGAPTPEQTQRPVRLSSHHFTLEFDSTGTRLETAKPAGIRLLLISSFDLKEKPI
jgi:hypothetical protein